METITTPTISLMAAPLAAAGNSNPVTAEQFNQAYFLVGTLLSIMLIFQIFGGIYTALFGVKMKKPQYD